MSPRVCPAASMENSFVSRVWLARGSLLIVLYCSKAKMRYNDELIRQIQKDCLHWTRPSLCSSIFFPRKNTLSTPVLFIPKRFFSMELLMFGVKTRSCYFLSLWYFGKQEVKSYCSTYWICQGLSNIFSKVNRNSCGVFKHQKKETRIFWTLRIFRHCVMLLVNQSHSDIILYRYGSWFC